jgi:hypothetical protein
MGGLGRKRGWPEVGFPRRPRRRRGGARQRGASRRGRWPSTGLVAIAGGGEAVGVVGLGGEGAKLGARQRQELTGEEGIDGDRTPVKDWRRGGVVELRRGAVKLSRWSSGTMGAQGGSSAATRGSPAKKKNAAVVFRALGDWRAKERVEWEERELVLLLN